MPQALAFARQPWESGWRSSMSHVKSSNCQNHIHCLYLPIRKKQVCYESKNTLTWVKRTRKTFTGFATFNYWRISLATYHQKKKSSTFFLKLKFNHNSDSQMLRGAHINPADAWLDPTLFCTSSEWETSFALPFHECCHSPNSYHCIITLQ